MTIDELCALLRDGAKRDDEERLDLLAHGLQCAELLAARAPHDVELQAAGLVHDVGTVVDPYAMDTHAGRGGALVAPLLGARVGRLVALHADAKRYLVATDSSYRSRLSARSLETLIEQGGVMDECEVAAFAGIAELDAVLALRRADDDAKVPGRPVADLDTWRPILEQLTR
ncbi:MAG: HD domain-containing protein [Acidimicrobiia bacterium]